MIYVSFFFKKRYRESNNWSKNSFLKWPNAEVILCLKGADENLREKLFSCMSSRAAANIQDEMEALGIYEVAEEDLALCEVIDSSKTEVQSVIRKGIDLMLYS